MGQLKAKNGDISKSHKIVTKKVHKKDTNKSRLWLKYDRKDKTAHIFYWN